MRSPRGGLKIGDLQPYQTGLDISDGSVRRTSRETRSSYALIYKCNSSLSAFQCRLQCICASKVKESVRAEFEFRVPWFLCALLVRRESRRRIICDEQHCHVTLTNTFCDTQSHLCLTMLISFSPVSLPLDCTSFPDRANARRYPCLRLPLLSWTMSHKS
jgi:hypothetical protein